MKDSNVVIFGGTGFVGASLSSSLRGSGLNVTTVARHLSATHSVDLMKIDSRHLATLLQRQQPSVVINLAGCGLTLGSATESEMTSLNSHFPLLLVNALSSMQGVRLLHIASSTEPKNPTAEAESLYSKTKGEGSDHVRRALAADAIVGSVVTLHNTYGPTQPPERFVRMVLDKAIRGQSITLKFPERVRDFIYLDDATRGLTNIATEYPTMTDIEMGTGQGISLRDVAQTIYELCGSSASLVLEEEPTDDPFRFRVAESPLSTLPRTRSFDQGIASTLAEILGGC